MHVVEEGKNLTAICEDLIIIFKGWNSHFWVNLGVPLVVVVHFLSGVHWDFVKLQSQLGKSKTDNLGLDTGSGTVEVDLRVLDGGVVFR